MKNTIYIFLLCTFILSCKKDSSKKDKKLLIDNYIIYFNGIEYEKQNFIYDSQNRIKETKLSYYDYSEKKTVRTSYEYDSLSNPTVALISGDVSSEKHFFYLNGILIKEELKALVENPATQTGTYTITNGRVSKCVIKSDISPDSLTYEYTYDGGNTKTFKVSDITTTYYYGNKNNPFKYTGFNWNINHITNQNKNQSDVIRLSISNNKETKEIIYNNVYNEYEYPVEVTYNSTNVYTNQEGTFKVVYNYREAQ